jgi:LuxR family transcriptional regulator, maltose regulon positive regulatory protein
LQSPPPPPIESVLTTLINDISAIEDDFALILDDLHVIDAEPVHSAIAFLLDHLPPQMHLVIASRADPPLPLARLRGRGEATELRASDLRFTPDEAAAFLTEVMGLDLSAGDVAALEARTEGWIAGLQLAALSMQRRADVPGFIRAFTGDDRYIVDFLVEEVLRHQPDRVRSFLLQTSILDRLSGPLCDAVTGQDDGTEMLGALERGNLFVMPLDDKRQWYRYHHLFADVLQAHYLKEQPDQIPVRHRRASAWYEQHGLRSDAIRHALAAEDFARAAGLVEMAALAMLGSSQEATLHGWLTALPDEVVRARPVLSVYYAFASFSREGFDAAEARLRDAERWLDTTADVGERRAAPSVEMVVVDDVGFRSLPGTIAVARAYRAGALGDVAGIVMYARRAVDLLPEGDDLWRGAAATLLGIGYWTSGELEAAYRSFAEGRARLQRTSYTQFQIVSVHILADIRMAQGRLHEVERIYEQALRLATEQGDPAWGTADVYVGLSELYRERDDLEAATQYLRRSKELGEHAGLPDTRHLWYVAMARIKEAHGDLDGALDLLDEAERQYVRGADPDVRPVAALKTRVWVAQGRLAEALGWVRERSLSVDDDISYLREFEHLTLARVLIARSTRQRDDRSLHEAIGLLERLLKAAEAGERTGSVIEILVLQALAHEARGDIPQALGPLERALPLAEPEGYVRIFVGEGEAMRTLLRHAAARGTAPIYTQRLLSAFDKPARPASTPAQIAATDLTEPLTMREVEILRLIAAGMRNQEIADQLFISLSTVKRHIANAYGKLGVRHRTEAAARANELNLLYD